MKIKVIGSSNGDGERHQFLLSYVCNETVAIDAGCIGLMTPLEEQTRIRHVFLTHSHLDHTASLPIFLDNVYVHGPDSPCVYAHPATLQSLQTDFFNDRVWPDLLRLSREESPFLQMFPLAESETTFVDGLAITPIELAHVVPTFAYLVGDDATTVAIISDTSRCERVWNVLNNLPRLGAIFLEVSFPNSLTRVADESMHLTPKSFAEELRRLKRETPIFVVHVKPSNRAQVLREVAELQLAQVQFAEPGREYRF